MGSWKKSRDEHCYVKGGSEGSKIRNALATRYYTTVVTRTKEQKAKITHIVLKTQCTTPIANASGCRRRYGRRGWFGD
jgi:hypothetical protein